MNIRERVQARVDALGESAITLAKRVGLERGFINDILIGRKATIRFDKLPMVARALKCDPRYITGEISKPQPIGWLDPDEAPGGDGDLPKEGDKAPMPLREIIPGIPMLGVCETGVWRKQGAQQGPARRMTFVPDPSFPTDPQVCFEVRGPGMDAEKIVDGMMVLGIEYRHFVENVRALESGMIVVLRRERRTLQEVELSLRKVEIQGRSTRLVAASLEPAIGFEPIEIEHPPQGEELRVLAVISVAFKRFL
jgi:transcriptional regulator with XRE-family HTH domain